MLLHKPPCPIEIYNDLEDEVANLFHVLADDLLFGQFQHLAELSLYSETLSDEFLAELRAQGDTLPPFLRAFMYWYVNRSRHNGVGGFSMNTIVRRGMSKSTSDMLSSVEGLAGLHERLQSVMVCHQDALTLIPRYDRVKTLL